MTLCETDPLATPRALAAAVGTLAQTVPGWPASLVGMSHEEVIKDLLRGSRRGASGWMSMQQGLRYAVQTAGVLLSSLAIPTLACDQVLRRMREQLEGARALCSVELIYMMVQLHTGAIGQLMPESLCGGGLWRWRRRCKSWATLCGRARA